MTDKRYQLRQEDLDYPIYSDLVDIEDNDRVICTFNNDSQINKMIVLLNEKEERIKELEKENEQLKHSYKKLKHRHSLLHDECLEIECDRDSLKKDVISLEKENEQLKQELFESKKDYIIETYSNNPIRRDKKLQILKEEFKERFGDLATYITSDELLFDIINETIEKGNSND